jgi:hypothetical protein
VLNTAKHDAYHIRMGDDPSRRMTGVQVGDGNVQTYTFGER